MAKVRVLCTDDRQVGDDLYVNGVVYTIDSTRAAKYADYFKVDSVVEGDALDGMNISELVEYATERTISISVLGSRPKRPGLLALIREVEGERSAESGAAVAAAAKSDGDDDEGGDNDNDSSDPKD